ncbi:MAG: ribosomal L7Ae/L30e/S12e/Gadd45 family protein [Clostridia bacterium]|nr:ribosomal L7Ae/L30e/S12e/Gadd45 family protein [Clostridia bacterium]
MDKFLNLLGMCRRAGKLKTGHDAAVESIVKNTAVLCLVSVSASQRLENEIRHACAYEQKNIRFMKIRYTTPELTRAIGTKAAVLTVEDEGFAKKLVSLYADE